jgi:hypothetical protein
MFFLTMIRRLLAEQRRAYNLWLLPVVTLAAVIPLLSGCASLLPGSDPIVVRAEQATQLLYVTTDRFLLWEHQNREKYSGFKQLADKLRQNVPWVLQRCRDATKEYKKQRNEATKRVLIISLASVETMLHEAQLATAVVPSFNPPQPPPPQ